MHFAYDAHLPILSVIQLYNHCVQDSFGASKKKRHAPHSTAATSTRPPHKRASEESTPSKKSGSDFVVADDAELVLDWSDDPSDQWQRSVASDSDSDDAPGMHLPLSSRSRTT